MRASTHEATWSAVNDALDQRRDPLDDPKVIAALESAPELIAEVAALRSTLRVLPSSAATPRRRLLPMLLTAAAAAAALLAVGFWPRDPVQPVSAPEVSALQESLPRGRVLLASTSTSLSRTAATSAGILDYQETVSFTRP